MCLRKQVERFETRDIKLMPTTKMQILLGKTAIVFLTSNDDSINASFSMKISNVFILHAGMHTVTLISFWLVSVEFCSEM